MILNSAKPSPDWDYLVSKFNIAASRLLLQAFLATSSASSTKESSLKPLITFYSGIHPKQHNTNVFLNSSCGQLSERLEFYSFNELLD